MPPQSVGRADAAGEGGIRRMRRIKRTLHSKGDEIEFKIEIYFIATMRLAIVAMTSQIVFAILFYCSTLARARAWSRGDLNLG